MTVEHWQAAYEAADQHSWDQPAAAADLDLLIDGGLSPRDSVLDVGGGDGAFTQTLLERGHRDLAVLDIADGALSAGRRRLGDRHVEIDWIVADIRTWVPERVWQLWHDRAVFHFLTTGAERAGYLRALAAAITPGALVCVGTFAEDGPTHCSGLPVARYAPAQLAQELGGGTRQLELLATGREVHRTPKDAEQPFSWVLMKAAD